MTQDCYACALGTCLVHERPTAEEVDDDAPLTEAQLAEARWQNGISEAFRSLACAHPFVKRECEIRGIEGPDY